MPTNHLEISLFVWRKAKELAVAIYTLTGQFPKSEIFGLVSQMQRAVISVSSNIAEGYNRFQQKEKRQFMVIAFGSAAELESQIDIAKELFKNLNYQGVEELLREILSMLNRMISLRS